MLSENSTQSFNSIFSTMKKAFSILVIATMIVTLSACKRDVYGKLFVQREPVTFRVQSEDGRLLSNVSLKTEELDDFDYDLIVDGTHYAYTDDEGKVTVDAPYYNSEHLAGRTTRFTFIATDYVVFDTIFNCWTEDVIDIVLHRE